MMIVFRLLSRSDTIHGTSPDVQKFVILGYSDLAE
jgi:hypothetical protein